MDRVLRLAIAIASAAAVSVLVAWLSEKLTSRLANRHPGADRWSLVRKCRLPVALTLFSAMMLGSTTAAQLGDWYGGIRHVVVLLLIAAVGWLLNRVVMLLVITSYNRYAASAADRSRVRRVGTQVGMIRRVLMATVVVLAVSSMLLTFPGVRAIGTSLLASAGLFGVVAGVAAQATLGNLFAGLQVAFSDMVRIGDVVVVNGEYGTVEEITLSYLVIMTWDQRRLVMPVSYFSAQPYENWTRTDTRLNGTVYLHLDHRVPVAVLREELHRILRDSGLWDGQAWSLVVTDTTPSTVEVRAMLTAQDADDVWTLRCTVREELLKFLVENHPYALPRVTTAVADPVPGAASGTGPSHGALVAPREAEKTEVAKTDGSCGRDTAVPHPVELEKNPDEESAPHGVDMDRQPGR